MLSENAFYSAFAFFSLLELFFSCLIFQQFYSKRRWILLRKGFVYLYPNRQPTHIPSWLFHVLQKYFHNCRYARNWLMEMAFVNEWSRHKGINFESFFPPMPTSMWFLEKIFISRSPCSVVIPFLQPLLSSLAASSSVRRSRRRCHFLTCLEYSDK